MRKKKASVFPWVALIALPLITGCVARGISGPGKTTTLGYDLTKLKERKTAKNPPSVPLHLVVAQAGSIQPEPEMIKELRRHKNLFRKVSALPAAPEVRGFNSEVEQRDPEELLSLAEGMGGDLLLLVGGKMDVSSSRTPASVLDLTIVGHYLAPTSSIKAEGSVLAAAIAIQKRCLVFTTQKDLKKKRFSPSVSRHRNTDALADRASQILLIDLAEEFARQFADRSGILIEPLKRLGPSKKATQPTDKAKLVATVYVVSDGFHIDLILPTASQNGKKRYMEIGLGERNWAMSKNWKWLNGIMAGIVPNEGVAIVQFVNEKQLEQVLEYKKRVWQINLTSREWGRMLETLENDLMLQEVLVDWGEEGKVVRTVNGYHLFYNCHHFVLNPLARAGKGAGGGFPKLTPILERHLDNVLGTKSKTK